MTERYAPRLNTKNFRQVTSHAVRSVDYNPRAKVIEIEYTEGAIYHYLSVKKTEWDAIRAFSDKGKGLGGYINQVFKSPYTNGEREYYKVNVIGEAERS